MGVENAVSGCVFNSAIVRSEDGVLYVAKSDRLEANVRGCSACTPTARHGNDVAGAVE